jgi:hypothetical protein
VWIPTVLTFSSLTRTIFEWNEPLYISINMTYTITLMGSLTERILLVGVDESMAVLRTLSLVASDVFHTVNQSTSG